MAENYKSAEDPERAFYLISALNIMRDYPKTTALAASFIRELHEMNERQVERDAEEQKRKQAGRAPSAPHADIGAVRRGA
jgi:hypothetical protein